MALLTAPTARPRLQDTIFGSDCYVLNEIVRSPLGITFHGSLRRNAANVSATVQVRRRTERRPWPRIELAIRTLNPDCEVPLGITFHGRLRWNTANVSATV